MTMDFNMASSNLGNASSTSGAYLAPNKIHDVTYQGMTYTADKAGKWEAFDVLFADASGASHRHRIFGLKDDCKERKTTQYGENPSGMETYMMVMKHLVGAISPEILADLTSGKLAFVGKKNAGSGFKQYSEFIAKALEAHIGTETQLKLVADTSGRAACPSFPVAVSKQNPKDVYMKTNFIGQGLKFTAKELEAVQLAAMAKPTPVAKAAPQTTSDDMSMGEMAMDTTVADADLSENF